MKFSSLLPISLLACTLLAGCAGYSPGKNTIGADRAAVTARMGKPAHDVQLAEGIRLVYPRGPYGRHTYFVDLNSQGLVTRWEQVLTEENFKRIQPNQTKAASIRVLPAAMPLLTYKLPMMLIGNQVTSPLLSRA